MALVRPKGLDSLAVHAMRIVRSLTYVAGAFHEAPSRAIPQYGKQSIVTLL